MLEGIVAGAIMAILAFGISRLKNSSVLKQCLVTEDVTDIETFIYKDMRRPLRHHAKAKEIREDPATASQRAI